MEQTLKKHMSIVADYVIELFRMLQKNKRSDLEIVQRQLIISAVRTVPSVVKDRREARSMIT